jgi:Fe-S-cluster containining protein
MKGGPALHIEDIKLMVQKFIEREHLITIRKGEPVFSLEKDKTESAENEIIKLKGTDSEWSCIFYDQESSTCSNYQHRPLECILLKCWDTAELKAIAGKRLLNRLDLISKDEPVIQYIQRHERECDLSLLHELNTTPRKTIDKNILAELTVLVNKDLAIRAEALMHLNFTLDLELFYFGRPVFKILSQFALIPREINGKIILIQA